MADESSNGSNGSRGSSTIADTVHAAESGNAPHPMSPEALYRIRRIVIHDDGQDELRADIYFTNGHVAGHVLMPAIIDQRRLRTIVTSFAGFIPPRLKTREFDACAQQMLATAEHADVSPIQTDIQLMLDETLSYVSRLGVQERAEGFMSRLPFKWNSERADRTLVAVPAARLYGTLAKDLPPALKPRAVQAGFLRRLGLTMEVIGHEGRSTLTCWVFSPEQSEEILAEIAHMARERDERARARTATAEARRAEVAQGGLDRSAGRDE